MEVNVGFYGGWALFLLVVVYPVSIWAAMDFGKAMAVKPHKPSGIELLPDTPKNRNELKNHALIFGEDGQIVECDWFSRERSARCFGGKPQDYYSGWLTWEREAVDFKIRGIFPVPSPTVSAEHPK